MGVCPAQLMSGSRNGEWASFVSEGVLHLRIHPKAHSHEPFPLCSSNTTVRQPLLDPSHQHETSLISPIAEKQANK